MRYDLAVRVATLIEHYITYRPEWLAAWSDGRDVAFDDGAAAAHAALAGRAVAADRGGASTRANGIRRSTFFAAIEAARHRRTRAGRARTCSACRRCRRSTSTSSAASRASSTSTSTSLNPCREYWFDIVDAKRLSWLAARGSAAHHETGNRLLAAWGAPAKAFLSLLFDGAADDAVVDDAPFVAGGRHDAARRRCRTRSSISPIPRRAASRSPTTTAASKSTSAIRARASSRCCTTACSRCSRPIRPSPADVLVVTPDLASPAPLIDAVFGNALPPRHIPYAITGRPRSEANPVAGALLAALALAPSRFAASDVFDLLQRPIVARRFGLDADALALGSSLDPGVRHPLGTRRAHARGARPSGGGALHVRRRPRPPIRGLRVADETRRRRSTDACRPATPKAPKRWRSARSRASSTR